jgi:ABC-2 type transport system permease protein
MNGFWQRARVIARREFLATVRRRAFLITAIGTPAYFALIMFLSIGPRVKDRVETMEKFRSLAVVDSSGLYQGADTVIHTDLDDNPFAGGGERTFTTQVRFFDDVTSAEQALRGGTVDQVLVVPADYLETGRVRRYALKYNLLSSVDRRPIQKWLVTNLLAGRTDSLRSARAAQPTAGTELFALNKQDRFELKDDRREVADFLLPMAFAMLLGVSIVVGGQYLLQGVSEEKESRILESMLCTVSAEELLAGKLLGLGGAGLSLVALWTAAGATLASGGAAAMQLTVSPSLLAVAVVYFLLGYLFYASLMTAIGGVTNNLREAQQFAVWFTFANFVPFIMLAMIISKPDSNLAVGLSLFPPTAATAMMLRLAAPSSSVPWWQVALSLALLAGTAAVILKGAAKIFRIGLLMYGKTPTLPEILRWARS